MDEKEFRILFLKGLVRVHEKMVRDLIREIYELGGEPDPAEGHHPCCRGCDC